MLASGSGDLKVANNPVFFGKFLDEVTRTISKGLIPVFGLEDTKGLRGSLTQLLIHQMYPFYKKMFKVFSKSAKGFLEKIPSSCNVAN